MGEEIIALERQYNKLNGFVDQDDFLPERFFTDEGSSGEGIDVPALDRARFAEELERYYRIRKKK
jgi:aldehyde:ferredoxin oxidoreductase